MAQPCGKHTTLSENPGAKVSQCTCGAVHVLVKASGVTVQLSEDRFQELGLAVMGAVSKLGAHSKVAVDTPDRVIN